MQAWKRFGISLLLITLMIGNSTSSSSSFAQSGLTIEARVLHDANLRMGPGVTYVIIGFVKAGQWVTVTDYKGDWYQLSSGEWLAKFLVAATPASRVVAFRLEDAPATANRAANLRSGPGIGYAIVGGVQAGQSLQIVGRNRAGDWFQLLDGQWIAAFLVNRVDVGLPIVGEIVEEMAEEPAAQPESPLATPSQSLATPDPTQSPITPPASSTQNCDPSYPEVCIPPYPPDLNCEDIPYQDFEVIGADPHNFDGDNNGIGCES